jgi:hypothetical protein
LLPLQPLDLARESDGEHKCLGEAVRLFRQALRAPALPLMMPMSASPADSSPDITSRVAPVTAHTDSGQSNGLMITRAVTTAATIQMIARRDIV